jgi:hypothetical protein
MSLAAPNYYTPGARNVPAMICDVNVDQLKCQSRCQWRHQTETFKPCCPNEGKGKVSKLPNKPIFRNCSAQQACCCQYVYSLSADQQWSAVGSSGACALKASVHHS